MNWERIFKRLHNCAIIKKTASFWDPVIKIRMSHQRCAIKKDVLKNVAIFTRKHLW